MIHRPLPVYRLDQLKDEVIEGAIDGIDGNYAERVFDNCPAVFSLPDSTGQQSLPFNGEADNAANTSPEVTLKQLGHVHGRSFEVVDPVLPTIWHDHKGNPYSSINLKGNNFVSTGLFETATAPDGVIAYGLQEGSVIRRVLRGSRMLLAGGITTEKILGLAEPAQYPTTLAGRNVDHHKLLSLDEYKKHIVTNHWRTLPEADRTPENLANLFQKFERMTFYITLRAMDTSYRLGEMRRLDIRQHLFTVANSALKPEETPDYDVNVQSDMDRLLEEVTIPRLAKNLALMHAEGFAHRFPNRFNITAFGSIVDLDSLHGEPLDLGDDPITADDIVADLVTAMDAFELSMRHLGDRTVMYKRHQQLFDEYYGWFDRGLHWPVPEKDIIVSAQKLGRSDVYLSGLNSLFGSTAFSKIITGKLIKEVNEGTGDALSVAANCWIEENQTEIIPQVTEALRSDFPEIAKMIFTELDSKYFQPGFKAFNYFLDSLDTNKFMVTHEFIHDMIIEKIARVFLVSDAFREFVFDNDEYDQADFEHFLAHSRPGGELVSGIWGDLWQRDLTELEKLATIQAHPSVMGETFESRLYLPSHNNVFALETDGVLMSELLDQITIDERVAQITVKAYADPSEGCYKPEYFLSDELAVITEFITDGSIDLISYEPGDKLAELELEKTRSATYAAIVELQQDGTKHITIFVDAPADKKLDWQKYSESEAVDMLRYLYEQRDKLFDDSRYINHHVPDAVFSIRPVKS